jgi:AraC family transcriptional regulator
MSDVGIILKAIDYIEEHLEDAVTVADIAAYVSFSLYHFTRVFNRVTHHTPYDYLMRRRLSEATRVLLETERKIIDIAFDYQFNAPETFSRAFRRVYHQQPRCVRSTKQIDQRLFTTKPSLPYLEFLNRFTLKPASKSLPTIRVTGIANQVETRNATTESRLLWDFFHQQLVTSKLTADLSSQVGILLYPSPQFTEYAMYIAGLFIQEDKVAPSSFIQKDLPASDYACFNIPEKSRALQYIRRYVYQSWWSKAANAPLPEYELECFSKSADKPSSTIESCKPGVLCFPMPDE